MNWLKAKLRTWLGIENERAADLVFVNQLAAQVMDFSVRVNHLENAMCSNATHASKPGNHTKPYRTASEIRNKLERTTDEKA